MEILICLFIGIGLSATSGFRLFVPFLIMSVASLAGYLELASGFEWIGSYPALAIFAIAAAVEILAYFFPYVDNLVSACSVPLAAIAGIIITASVIVDLDPMLTWSLAVIAGGGASLSGKATSALLHTGSTTVTGGVANPVLSLVETIYAIVMAILSILVPVLAILFLILIILVGVKLFRRKKARKRVRGRFLVT